MAVAVEDAVESILRAHSRDADEVIHACEVEVGHEAEMRAGIADVLLVNGIADFQNILNERTR